MSFIRTYINEVVELIHQLPEDQLLEVVDVIQQGYLHGRGFFVMGNGGSAATASHIVNDLQKCIPPVAGGRPYRAMALTDSVPLMLAWANDTEYANIFCEQLRNWVQKDDIVLGISGSGNSENVIRAIELANEAGALTIGLSGYDGGRLLQTARLNIHVPTFNMQQAEDLHMVALHLIFSALRDNLDRSSLQTSGLAAATAP